jgi:hypothetical protein
MVITLTGIAVDSTDSQLGHLGSVPRDKMNIHHYTYSFMSTIFNSSIKHLAKVLVNIFAGSGVLDIEVHVERLTKVVSGQKIELGIIVTIRVAQ